MSSETQFGNDGLAQNASVTSRDVQTKIDAANVTLKALLLRAGPASMRAEGGDSAAIANLQSLSTQIRELRERIEVLGFTLVEAERIERLKTDIDRENEFVQAADKVIRHLTAMDRAAANYGEAEKLRAGAWAEVIKHRDKALASAPKNFAFPSYYPEVGDLRKLGCAEAYRVSESHDTSIGTISATATPGAEVLHADIGQPDRIKPFATEVAGFNRQVVERLKAVENAFKSSSVG